MRIDDKIHSVKARLAKQNIAGWLLYHYRAINPIARQFLEIPPGVMATRRCCYWIPASGTPLKIVSSIEPFIFDHLPGEKWVYTGWREFEECLSKIAKKSPIAMEYSPNSALPSVSLVDAGLIDLLRAAGGRVVSSADILQFYTSVWSHEQVESHFYAAKVLEDIAALTWDMIQANLKAKTPLDEYGVVCFMQEEMKKRGCISDHSPTCAVGANSADPHYHPNEKKSSPIRSGDFILLDLWCKMKLEKSVYADITRVGVAAKQATSRQKAIFHVVKEARDCATALVVGSHAAGESLCGWQVDQACRDVIVRAGYGQNFIHRTGHNLGEEVHGRGANIDNFETHDHRELLPGSAFTIEPGIYLPGEFGVRLEYDIYLEPSGPAHITGGIQTELHTF